MEKLQQLYEIEMIKQLKAKYCYYTDGYFTDPSNFERLMKEVFMEDTEFDFGLFGIHKGRKEVERFFKDVVFVRNCFYLHRVVNPIITILNEKEATGKWSFLVPTIAREDNSAQWIGGTYDEKYEKRDGQWHIKKIKANFNFYSPYDKGWAKENLIVSQG
jgi:hypothetical protein